MWISDKEQCTIHGPNDVLKALGTCGYWIKGHPITSNEGSAHGNVTKAASGYEVNRQGFSCKRCKAFEPKGEGKGRCKLVKAEGPGYDRGNIHPNGCCAAWTADPRRSKMSNDAFTALETAPRIRGM